MKRFIVILTLLLLGIDSAFANDIRLENKHFAMSINAKSTVTSFIDKRSGENMLRPGREQSFCSVIMKQGQGPIMSNGIVRTGDLLKVTFPNRACVTLKYQSFDQYITLNVESFDAPDKEPFYRLDFGRAFLKIDYTKPNCFGASALILTIQTNTLDYPGQTTELGGRCYSELGYKNARIALVGIAEKEMRSVMKEVAEKILARAASDPEYKKIMPPVSRAGGGFAYDIPKNFGSYIITGQSIKKDDVKKWADHLAKFGVNQIDFHQGVPFRQGDFLFDTKAYPNGASDFRKMTDEMKKFGLIAGLHTYAEFISWGADYLTPVPHKDLMPMKTYTLAEDLNENANEVKVIESTENVTTTTGFFVLNSTYLQIDNELITFQEVGKNGFPKCKRGYMKTRQTSHKKGAPVKHLAQMFSHFAPDPDSELFLEIARNTAKAYDDGGFKMIYLDALDGTYSLLKNKDYVWFYDALFVREIINNIKSQPPLLEYSTMHPSLWAARSRMGAWDSPSKGYQRFFDLHFASNLKTASARYLPGQMGWFAVYSGGDYADNYEVQTLYREHLEYLGAKALAHNFGLSYLGISLEELVPAAFENGNILKTYDLLRRENKIKESVKDIIKTPGKHFHLVQKDGRAFLVPATYEYLKTNETQVEARTNNPYQDQRPFIRIENRYTAKEYEAPNNIELIKFDENVTLIDKTLSVEFKEPIDLTKHLAMGLWVCGDGGGQWMNIRVESPHYLTSGFTDHFIKLDFNGWKYITCIECDNGELPELYWKCGSNSLYHEFREKVHYTKVNRVHLAVQGDVSNLRFRTLKAIPIQTTKMSDPTLRIGNDLVEFKGEIPSGHYAEYNPGDKEMDVKNPKGEKVNVMKVLGNVPVFKNGKEKVILKSSTNRARWTFGFYGDEIK